MNINSELVENLRLMKSNGSNVIEILENILILHGDDPLVKPLCMKYFRESFGLSMRDVLPIGGWCRLGGEISDEKMIEMLEPCIEI